MKNFDNIEIYSYFTLLLGVTFDHITTTIGISKFSLLESNQITRTLMSVGLWSIVDVLICMLLITICHEAYRNLLKKQSNILFLFPLLSGSLRLLIGIWNISIF